MNLLGHIERNSAKRIMIFVSHFGRGAMSAGPAKSIEQMIAAVAGLADVWIVARSDVIGRAEDSPINQWHREGGTNIYYASPDQQGVRGAWALIKQVQPDLLYLNSLFNAPSSIWPLLAARIATRKLPIVLAPRGELSEAALLEKRGKKNLYLRLAKLLRFHQGVTFHASGDVDAEQIRSQFPNSEIRTAMDIGVLPPPQTAVQDRSDDRLNILFLARITRIKNLDLAIDALGRCTRPVRFSIYGRTFDEGYERECRALLAKLPPHVDYDWHGEVSHEEVPALMGRHDLLLLPTGGENFCHVVSEALLAHTPVLISNRTNWTDRLNGDTSWAIPLEDGPQAFADVIDALAKETPMERLRRVYALMNDNPATKLRDEAIRDNQRLFLPGLNVDQFAAFSSPSLP